MGAFKPMQKMETTEPSAILKLKKGGHVDSKKEERGEHEHKPMRKAIGGITTAGLGDPRLATQPVEGALPGVGRPSMAERNTAMKKGGKLCKKEGGLAEASVGKYEHTKVDDGDKFDRAEGKTGEVRDGQGGYKSGGHLEKAKHHLAHHAKTHTPHSLRMAKHHLKLASGGTVSEKAAKPFEHTKVDEAKPDHHEGKTGEVKDGQGGYKKGGRLCKKDGGEVAAQKSAALPWAKAGGMSPKERYLALKEVSNPKEAAKPVRKKTGGSIDWENKPANTGEHYDYARGTGEVVKGQGGFKKGGSSKKKFADGGEVKDSDKGAKIPSEENPRYGKDAKGRYAAGGEVSNEDHEHNRGRDSADRVGATKYPARVVSDPVSNSRQSGTFKKGGKAKKCAKGGEISEGE